MSVATGGYWIGMACARRKVLYIDLETDKRTLREYDDDDGGAGNDRDQIDMIELTIAPC